MASVYKPYQPTESDVYYKTLARKYRLRMKPPEQSSFRVVSVITFKVIDEKTKNVIDKTEHVIGCNIEATPIRASVCAERCALFNLVARYPAQNFIIERVYVLTDAGDAKRCGLLCLEFLSSFGFKSSTGIKIISFSPNINCEVLTANIYNAYPFPPLYKYLGDVTPSTVLYAKFSKLILETSNTEHIVNHKWPQLWTKLYRKCIEMSQYDVASWHPLAFGGAVLFENNHIESCWMTKTLEYGASIECVPKLIHKMEIERLRDNKAVMLMIVDAYGVLHAPNGLERTVLIEQGFSDLKVAIHYHTNTNPKYFYQMDDDFEKYPNGFDIFVRTIKDIVPAPPNTDMLKGFVAHTLSKL